MATYEEIMVALRNADAAGDTAAATRLAAMARAAKAQPVAAPVEAPSGQGFGNNVAQQAGDGVFFGFGDEISARLNALTGYDAATGTYGNDTSYDQQLAAVRQQEKQFEADHPVIAPVAEIGGALATMAVPVGAVARGGNLVARTGRAAALGSGQGALYAAGEGEGGVANRARSAAFGGVLGGLLGSATPAAGALARRAVEATGAGRALKKAAAGAPSLDELRAQANALYARAEDAVLPRADVAPALSAALAEASRKGMHDKLTPRAAFAASQIAEALASPSPGIPFRELDTLRQMASSAAGQVTDKHEQMLGTRLIEALDDAVERADPSLGSTVGQARELWGRMRRAEAVADAMDVSGGYLSGSSSGVRNRVSSILKSPKKSRGYSAAEKAALARVANPGPAENLLHLAGGGLGQMAIVGSGGGIGGIPGAIAGAAVAGGARKASEAITRRKAELAQAIIANGGGVQMPTLSPARQALIEALYLSGIRVPTAGLADALR